MLEAHSKITEGAEAPADEPNVEVVGIRFKQTGKIYYFAPAGISFIAGEGVIVETARGQEYGFVAFPNRMVSEKETVQPLKEVIRKATEADGVKHAQNKEMEKKAAAVWEELVKKHKLVMSLTEVEYTFDNSKLIFYFTADGRVDFRELVKDLASVFRTRIELRQIGVRDEAKFLGGLGVCGMPFCCNRFLPDFVQVSIKMAKEQNLSLSSSKISGNCGRLMCCLRYEQDVYESEYATFPRTDMVVRTPVGTGVITESNFINGKIKVRMDGDGTAVYKIFTRDEVKVIGKAKTHNDEALEKELKALED
ncbi:MAG: stage 0 sporulation protein [Ruminococcaceae bacterium]|nr:stage 0 sporulation protein [Oscillospiraceae bacterium]